MTIKTENPSLTLLPRQALLKTGEVDYADWNYRPLLSWVQRQRFHLVLRLIGPRHFGRLLEVGYGSGILMPELSRHCTELYGIDKHAMHEAVAQRLAEYAVNARLYQASAISTPFQDQWFDAIVAVSSLEYVEDLEAACAEFARILRVGGLLIVITPGHSPLLDFGLKLLTGESAQKNYEKRRQALVPILARHFRLEEALSRPRYVGPLFRLYQGLRLAHTTVGTT
jgi:ubiquinone/menaquinone biosynthesis C-methylase UbiE